MHKYALLVGFYDTPDKDRNSELLFSLQENVKNKHISNIVVFNETPDVPVDSDKIVYVNINSRMTYKNYFKYANKHLSGQRCIIANSDIVISHDLEKFQSVKIDKAFICLSRWDKDGKRLESGGDSQDTWIFQSPVKEGLVKDADYPLGCLFSDIVLSFLAAKNNYMLWNPSKDIVTRHIHQSEFRNPSDSSKQEALNKTNGRYMLVHPNHMGEEIKVNIMESIKVPIEK
jgi:hypothetical protein